MPESRKSYDVSFMLKVIAHGEKKGNMQQQGFVKSTESFNFFFQVSKVFCKRSFSFAYSFWSFVLVNVQYASNWVIGVHQKC